MRVFPLRLLAPFVAILSMFASSTAQAAYLAAGSPAPVSGGYQVPIALAPGAGESIASLQFSLSWPEFVQLEHVAVGTAAAAAGKDLIYSLRGRNATVIVAGFNQTLIGSGLIAIATLSVKEGMPPQLLITNAVFADPRGGPVMQTPPPAPTPPGEYPPAPPEEDKDTTDPEVPAPADSEGGAPARPSNLMVGDSPAEFFAPASHAATRGDSEAGRRASQVTAGRSAADQSSFGLRDDQGASPITDANADDRVSTSYRTSLPNRAMPAGGGAETQAAKLPRAEGNAPANAKAAPWQMANAAARTSALRADQKPADSGQGPRDVPPDSSDAWRQVVLVSMFGTALLLAALIVWRRLRQG